MTRETDVKGHTRRTSYGVVKIKPHKRKLKESGNSPPSRRQTGRIEDPRIDRIEITRGEGANDADYSTHTFRSFREANRHLSTMAFTAPVDSSFKTDFKIHLKDGSEYTGTYDLKRQDMFGSNQLEKHIKPQLLAYSEIQMPSHFTDEQTKQFLRTNEPRLKQSSTEWLKAFGWHPNQ